MKLLFIVFVFCFRRSAHSWRFKINVNSTLGSARRSIFSIYIFSVYPLLYCFQSQFNGLLNDVLLFCNCHLFKAILQSCRFRQHHCCHRYCNTCRQIYYCPVCLKSYRRFEQHYYPEFLYITSIYYLRKNHLRDVFLE